MQVVISEQKIMSGYRCQIKGKPILERQSPGFGKEN
jgi:hypothetical protein